MNVRCFRCGWSFALGRDTIAAALANAATTGARHHDERCPRCRQVLKISLDQLKRTMPPGWTPPPSAAQATPAQTGEASSAPQAMEPGPASVTPPQAVTGEAPAPIRPPPRGGAASKPKGKADTTAKSKARKPAAKTTTTKIRKKTSAK